MNIAFCTCVQIGKSCIEAVLSAGGKFELLLTLHDEKSKNKSGRVYLDEIAIKNEIPLFKINHINDLEVENILTKYKIDWLFIIGWSQIASKDILKVPIKGAIGAHPTLLPVGRGRAAVPWAILKGLNKTGVTFFKMNEGVDTGEILDQIEIPISANENATSLYEKVNNAHVELIIQLWPKLLNDTVHGKIQDETMATYWDGRTPKDGELLDSITVIEADKLVRATTKPYPGAFKQLAMNRKLIVWSGSLNYIKDSIPIQFMDGIYYATEFEYI